MDKRITSSRRGFLGGMASLGFPSGCRFLRVAGAPMVPDARQFVYGESLGDYRFEVRPLECFGRKGDAIVSDAFRITDSGC